jgi:hypothetical protein
VRGRSTEEFAVLRYENEELRSRLGSVESAMGKLDRDLTRRRMRAKRWREYGAYGVAAAVGVGGVSLCVLHLIARPLPLTAVWFACLVLASALIVWGKRRTWTWTFVPIVWLGGFLAIFFGLYTVVSGVRSEDRLPDGTRQGRQAAVRHVAKSEGADEPNRLRAGSGARGGGIHR